MACFKVCVGVILFCFFFLETCTGNLQPLEFAFGEAAVRVGDLPAPAEGVLGLSQFIKPMRQTNQFYLYYPKSGGNNLEDQATYFTAAYIYFKCTQPTRRIAVHGNSHWTFTQTPTVRVYNSNGTYVPLEISETSFNPDDDTLYIDMVNNMVCTTDYTYRLLMVQRSQLSWGSTDRFGLQIHNRTLHDSGDVVITAALSAAPRSMRRLIPCFDDPAVSIPYDWNVFVHYGALYPPAKVMMSGYLYKSNGHECSRSADDRYAHFSFSLPKMAIEFTQLRVAPFAWFEETDVTPPPPTCY